MRPTTNSCNSGKTVLTDDGPLHIEVPREREGNFEPKFIGKHKRRFTGFDGKIIAMYARHDGGEIQEFPVEMSAPGIHRHRNDAVLSEVTAVFLRFRTPNNICPESVTVRKPIEPACFILDVDGVLTTGHFLYTAEGKVMKIFGPDDNDGLSLLKQHIEIRFITGDKKGFPITKKRVVDDMNFSLDIVSTIRRVDWIKERYQLDKVIYMGDGIFDHYVMREVGYAIAPANADKLAKQHADYVTERVGGDRSVAEACLHIMEKFFTAYDPSELPSSQGKLSGEWTV